MFQPLPSVRHRAGLAFASVTAQQLQWRVLSLELPRMFSAVTDKESELAKNGRCDVYCVVSGATRQRCRQATSVFIHAMPWNNSTSSAHAITRRHASNSSHQGHGCHGHSSLEQKRRERRQQASKPPATSPLSDHPYAKKQIGSSEPPPQPPLSKKFWTVKDSSQNSPTVEATGTASSTSGVNPLPSSTTRTVYYAFMGNTAILLLKGLMWMRSGSTAMMAETLHTFVDTLNQALLILGVRQSAIAPDRVHQYGYGRAAFFWGLVSALGLFWCGAGVTIFHGVEKLIHPPPVVWVDTDLWTVLAASLVIDGAVLYRATNEILTRASATDSNLKKLGTNATWLQKFKGIYKHLKTTQDPFITAVFLEDFSACLGVGIAALGIGLTQATGMVVFDSLASITIGGLLGGVAYRLVDMNKRFLLGQAVDQETVTGVTKLLLDMPSIEFVGEIQTQWVGPSTFAFKAEVDFDGTYLAANLHPRYEKLFVNSKNLQSELPVLLAMYAEDVTRLVERELKEVEDIIRAKYPAAAFIELEPDSKDTNMHVADRAGDLQFRLSEKEKVKRFVALILARRQAKLQKDRATKQHPTNDNKPSHDE